MTPRAQWDALMALWEKSTPGEWKRVDDPGEQCDECGEHQATHPHMIAHDGNVGLALLLDDDRDEANAAFIVAAHNRLPALAAEYRRMVEALEAVVKRAGPHADECSATRDMVRIARDALRGAKGEP